MLGSIVPRTKEQEDGFLCGARNHKSASIQQHNHNMSRGCRSYGNRGSRTSRAMGKEMRNNRRGANYKSRHRSSSRNSSKHSYQRQGVMGQSAGVAPYRPTYQNVATAPPTPPRHDPRQAVASYIPPPTPSYSAYGMLAATVSSAMPTYAFGSPVPAQGRSDPRYNIPYTLNPANSAPYVYHHSTGTPQYYPMQAASIPRISNYASSPQKQAPTPVYFDATASQVRADMSNGCEAIERKKASTLTYTPTSPSILDENVESFPSPGKKRVHFSDKLEETHVFSRTSAVVTPTLETKERERRVEYDPTQPQYSPRYDPNPYYNPREYNPLFPSYYD